MLDQVLRFTQQYDALTGVLGGVLITLIGFLLNNLVRKNRSPKTTNINVQDSVIAGRDVNIHNNNSHEKPKNILTFQKLLLGGNWKKEFINNQEKWLCQEDLTYQIDVLDNYSDFTEDWTRIYPDSLGSGKHSVILKIGETPIKEILFIYCDGGRISVPLPEIEMVGDKRKYYWDKASLQYNLGQLIGHFYIYENIEGVARMSGIELRG